MDIWEVMVMDALERALDARRDEIEREIGSAEFELKELRERERALEDLIRRARLQIGAPTPTERTPVAHSEARQPLALHDVIVRVLRGQENRPMNARDIANAVNASGLYRKRDGSEVEPSQIHARVHKYGYLFARESGRIQLRDAAPRTTDRALVAAFDAAMRGVYDNALREVGYSARRFLNMVERRGGFEAAQHLLAQVGESEGFKRLAQARKLALTMEYQVLRPEFRALFSDQERSIARARLIDAGFDPSQLPG